MAKKNAAKKVDTNVDVQNAFKDGVQNAEVQKVETSAGTATAVVEKVRCQRTNRPVAKDRCKEVHGITVGLGSVQRVEEVHKETGLIGEALAEAVKKDFAAYMQKQTLSGMEKSGMLPEGYKVREGVKAAKERMEAKS